MIKKLRWTPKAISSFENTLKYIGTSWSNREVEKFITDTSIVLKNISQFPQMYVKLSSMKLNKAPINNIISLIYREKHSCIEILFFWNNRQSPSKLTNIIN